MKMSYNFDDGGVCFKSVQHRFYYEINEREGGTTFSFSCNKSNLTTSNFYKNGKETVKNEEDQKDGSLSQVKFQLTA